MSRRNELQIQYSATTDKDTIANLTNHSHFNLAGSGNVLGHELVLHADEFAPVDKDLIPTGELRRVGNTALDFTSPTEIGARIDHQDEQLILAGGYDHNFVLRKPGAALSPAAEAYDPTTGRVLEVRTTQPALQFYSGNRLSDDVIGKGGRVYEKYAGFCLETQHFPDSPNRASFPATLLKAGQEYEQTTVFRFSAR